MLLVQLSELRFVAIEHHEASSTPHEHHTRLFSRDSAQTDELERESGSLIDGLDVLLAPSEEVQFASPPSESNKPIGLNLLDSDYLLTILDVELVKVKSNVFAFEHFVLCALLLIDLGKENLPTSYDGQLLALLVTSPKHLSDLTTVRMAVSEKIVVALSTQHIQIAIALPNEDFTVDL